MSQSVSLTLLLVVCADDSFRLSSLFGSCSEPLLGIRVPAFFPFFASKQYRTQALVCFFVVFAPCADEPRRCAMSPSAMQRLHLHHHGHMRLRVNITRTENKQYTYTYLTGPPYASVYFILPKTKTIISPYHRLGEHRLCNSSRQSNIS